jgi:hypothetical protein
MARCEELRTDLATLAMHTAEGKFPASLQCTCMLRKWTLVERLKVD